MLIDWKQTELLLITGTWNHHNYLNHKLSRFLKQTSLRNNNPMT